MEARFKVVKHIPRPMQKPIKSVGMFKLVNRETDDVDLQYRAEPFHPWEFTSHTEDALFDNTATKP